MIYFDHNATAPLHPAARDGWLAATEKFIGNPSSPHRLGGRAEKALADAREQLAGFLGCAASDIVWTSGATEANNAVLHHFACRADGAGEVWLSAVEHPCLRDAAEHFFPTDYGAVRCDGNADHSGHRCDGEFERTAIHSDDGNGREEAEYRRDEEKASRREKVFAEEQNGAEKSQRAASPAQSRSVSIEHTRPMAPAREHVGQNHQ